MTTPAREKRRQFLNIITLCCANNRDGALKLLKDCTGEKASNQSDLEYKLSLAYKNAEDKVAIEKKLSELHPHKDFILRYNKPIEVDIVPNTLIDEPITKEPSNIDAIKKTIEEVEKVTNLESNSNCNGNPNCSCNSNNNQSNFSSANGLDQNTNNKSNNTDHTQLIIAIIGISAIFGMALIYKNK